MVRDAVIVSAVRTAVGKAPRGTLKDTRPDEMAAAVIAEAVRRVPGLDPREVEDAFAYRSHRRAAEAIGRGKFADETMPLTVKRWEHNGGNGPTASEVVFSIDEGVRYDTSLESLASLKPAFAKGGVVTSGNSSQTSDGAAAVVVMSAEKAGRLKAQSLAGFRSVAAARGPPPDMGIGPVEAVPKAVRLAGVTLSKIDLIELNEAVAAPTLAVMRQLDLDPWIVNVNGGALALGHPLGREGAQITATLLHQRRRRNARYGLVTMCVGGGMGAAGVFERA